jgi:hypothetical protein
MKISIKFLMMALVLGVCTVACNKDEEKLPVKDAAGTYIGKITVAGTEVLDTTVANIPIEVKYIDGSKASLTVPAAPFGLDTVIVAECTVTSTADKYQLSGTSSFSGIPVTGLPGVDKILETLGENAPDLSKTPLTLIIADSSIDKSGNAIINIYNMRYK